MIDKSEKFEWLVRAGYLSRALLYVMLGFLALTSASAISEGTQGIFQAIEDFPAGTAVLWVMVVGLVAYALFRFASPVVDIENNGSDATGWGKRIGHAGSGIGHLALAWTAYKFATGTSEGSGDGAQDAAAGVLGLPLGEIALGALGLAFFLTSLFQFKKAVTAEFMQRIAGSAPSFTCTLGRIGFAARGVVYAVIGWSLIKAGFMASGADGVRSLGTALADLAGTGFLFTLTALGLLTFGFFSLILSRYRIIPEIDPDTRIPKFRMD